MKKWNEWLQMKLGKMYYPLRSLFLGVFAVLFFYGMYVLIGWLMAMLRTAALG